MKRKSLITVLLVATLLVHCSKDKKDNSTGPGNGLLAVFTMNDELKDSTGNIPKTEFSKGIKAAADRKGNLKGAMFFDAGKMWADVPDWPADHLTIACWVRPLDDLNDNYFVLSNTGAFGLYQNKTTIGLAISTPVTNSALANCGSGWIHLAGTYDGKKIRTYIDGELKKTIDHPGQPDHTSKIEVGALATPYWKGALDDLRFYNKVLTEEEISLLAAF